MRSQSLSTICLPEDLRVLRILLVDDSEDNRTIVQLYLKKKNYLVEIAENGQIAVDKYKALKYDLILMDLQMPVMDGYTASKAIRLHELEFGFDAVPIIALTALALPEDVLKSLEAGCDAHVTKPIKKQTLLQTIWVYTKGDKKDGTIRANVS